MSFKCPTCGDTSLFETMVNVTVISNCRVSAERGVEYVEQRNEGDLEVEHYQCNAGHIVMDDGVPVTEPERIAEMFGNDA